MRHAVPMAIVTTPVRHRMLRPAAMAHAIGCGGCSHRLRLGGGHQGACQRQRASGRRQPSTGTAGSIEYRNRRVFHRSTSGEKLVNRILGNRVCGPLFTS